MTDPAAGTDPLELDDVHLVGQRIIGVELEHAQVTGVVLEGCDLSGVVVAAYSVRRSRLMQTRIRDCVLGGGIVQDTDLLECPTERLSLRFSTLHRVTFTDCSLVGADFYGATFDRVSFTRCDLAGAHFDGATVKELTMQSCRFLGVTGALSLKGAVVDLDDLPGLAPSLAREAGLRFTVED